jgi:ankyrin repeat protein
MTPLHCAKNALIAKLLVKGGASVRVSDTRGDTPLHVVKSVEVAKCLIELKADPSIKNNEGFTPLRRVRLDKKLDVVAYLRKVGAPA